MSARDEVLARVRRAQGPRDPAPVPREYRAAGTRGPGDLDLFAERLRDYRARVRVVDADQVAEAVAAALRERGARRVVAAPGIPPEWTGSSAWTGSSGRTESSAWPELSDPAGGIKSRDPLGGDLGEADSTRTPGLEVVRTPEAPADTPAAPTRTPGPEITHAPVDVETLERTDAVLTACHVAIAETGTIVLDHDAADQGPRALTLVPDYHLVVVRADQVMAGVPDAVAALDGVRTQTWISGPSATSDIELERVEGVHGPRTLEVVIVR